MQLLKKFFRGYIEVDQSYHERKKFKEIDTVFSRVCSRFAGSLE